MPAKKNVRLTDSRGQLFIPFFIPNRTLIQNKLVVEFIISCHSRNHSEMKLGAQLTFITKKTAQEFGATFDLD